MKLFALALFVLLLPSAALAASPPSITREVASIERSTQQIRQLKPLRPVKAEFPTDAGFNAIVDRELRLDNPAGQISVGQRESVTLGLLGKNTDLRRIIYQNLSSQVLGLYDYRHKILYVRRQANQVFGPGRYAIAHEYTHALQDQHYNLSGLMPDENALAYRNTDAVSAHHALTEGDAVTTQTLFINRTYSSKDIQALIRLQEQPQKGPALPTSIQRQFYFPYTVGVSFVEKLYKLGGMAAVDAAYRRLPSSTYEIMFPDAYLKRWKPVSVSMHSVKGFPGWRQTDDDVFGAFGYHLVLWQFLSQKAADGAVRAYRGDRYIFLQHGSQNAMLLKSVWTSPAAAQVAQSTLLESLRVRYHGARVSGSSGATVVDPDGAVYVGSAGSHLTVVYAPTVAMAHQLAGAATT